MHINCKPAVSLIAGCAFLLITACATTRMDAQWTNPEYQAVAPAVVCAGRLRSPGTDLQRICEEKWRQRYLRGRQGDLELAALRRGYAAGGNDPYLAAARKSARVRSLG